MAGIILSSLLPKDNRLTVTVLLAGAGAFALYLEYNRMKRNHGGKSVYGVGSKIQSGNDKLEEAIRYYESALVDMQQHTQRTQLRAMLLRAYEIQAILSPDVFNLRSSVMIEGPSINMDDIVKESIGDITTPEALRLERRDSVSTLSEFYETFDFLEDTFYQDQTFLHSIKEFKCRTNRWKLFGLTSPSEFLVKVQCVRLAIDSMLSTRARAEWILNTGCIQTARLLDLAGADSNAFRTSFDKTVAYVSDIDNVETIRAELTARRVPCFNLYDIVIDFCLLDSFDDLDLPPTPVTAIISNSWISQRVRKSMLTSAVWGMVASKSSKAAPHGFLSHFYEIMGTLSPALAWGFLGDDAVLRPICVFIRASVTDSLLEVFDDSKTDYSTVEKLADSVYRNIKCVTEQIAERLDHAENMKML